MSPRGTSSSVRPRFDSWLHEYEEALSEGNTISLFKRIEVAEAAILTRRADLGRNSSHDVERQALEEALTKLRLIKRERLKFE